VYVLHVLFEPPCAIPGSAHHLPKTMPSQSKEVFLILQLLIFVSGPILFNMWDYLSFSSLYSPDCQQNVISTDDLSFTFSSL
jgi:hypothetical protein